MVGHSPTPVLEWNSLFAGQTDDAGLAQRSATCRQAAPTHSSSTRTNHAGSRKTPLQYQRPRLPPAGVARIGKAVIPLFASLRCPRAAASVLLEIWNTL